MLRSVHLINIDIALLSVDARTHRGIGDSRRLDTVKQIYQQHSCADSLAHL